MAPNPPPLRVGDKIHGYVRGYYGRDHYSCGRIEAIGFDWVVMRTDGGVACAATGEGVIEAHYEARMDYSFCDCDGSRELW